MTSLILALLLSGIIAGLIQYFVDFRGLPIYTPNATTQESIQVQSQPRFWRKLLNFLTRNWQFFGYLIVGIAGAFLVPAIDQLLHLRGIQEFLSCINQKPENMCKDRDWNLLVIFGYGIVSGYSSVRIIRGFGSFITGNISKDLNEQRVALDRAQKEIEDLKSTVAQPSNTNGTVEEMYVEGVFEDSFCDASENIDGLEVLASNCTQFSPPWSGKKWRVAKSLKRLLHQVNLLAPERSMKFDGTIGDLRHQATNSDHNPWVLDAGKNQGIVTALDITHTTGECDCNKIAASLEKNKDKRVKYVIWNSRIMNSLTINGSPAWTWRPYSGRNPHDKHIHISVHCEKTLCDDERNWVIEIV
jgi:hypothetical protein